jgi:DNA-3-methyladenine glycosylase
VDSADHHVTGLLPAPPSFFARDALVVAKDLIGAHLVVARRGKVRVVRIVETEAYRGPTDAASHARAGLTRRTRTLLGPPGRAYVFLVYGMHECFNVVCFEEGAGHAVLVRAGEPVLGIEPGLRMDGPGKFTRALGLTRDDDGADLATPSLFVALRAAPVKLGRSPRVGVAYAGAIADKPWRFYDRRSSHVSKPPRGAIGRGAG